MKEKPQNKETSRPETWVPKHDQDSLNMAEIQNMLIPMYFYAKFQP